MKKLLALALVLVMLASLAACSTVNKSEVSILWKNLEYNKDKEIVMAPNSLINAVERAMYIENISYTHYDCDDDGAKQLEQAKKVVDAGCSALVVELVDETAAQSFVDLAKAKSIPVVFLGCEVDEAVVSGYDKCFSVSTKAESVAASLSEKIAEGIITEKKGLFSKKATYTLTEGVDRNEDGKISYMLVGDGAAIAEAVDAKLTAKGLNKLELVAEATDAETAKTKLQGAVDGKFTNKDKDEVGLLTVEDKPVEMIITTDDSLGLAVLTALQDKGYNKDRLKTHFVSVYTVGSHADAKSLLNKADYKTDEWTDLIYTTLEVVDAGLLSGTAMEDYDTIATALAKLVKNVFKGKTPTDGLDAALVTKTRTVDVPYSIS